MSVRVCSLAVSPDEEIPPNTYTLLKFPYGAAESYDAWNMHPAEQPDGVVSAFPDDRSGLIWPAAEGWGDLIANIHWEGGGYTELRDRFARDPLGLYGAPDTTATDHRVPSPGGQYFTKHHGIFVHVGTPLGVLVSHDDSVPRKVIYAQFKLTIHSAEAL